MSEALMWTKTIADALPTLFQLFTTLGSRDAFLEACDQMLAAARRANDASLRRKHEDDKQDDGA